MPGGNAISVILKGLRSIVTQILKIEENSIGHLKDAFVVINGRVFYSYIL